MNRRISALQALGATVLLNGALMPAAMAAWNWDSLPNDGWSLLLAGSLVVLAVASVLQITTRRSNHEPERTQFGSRFFGPQLYPQGNDDRDAPHQGA